MQMNYFNHFLVPLLLVALTACQPPVVFGEPQPVDTRSISNFPEVYQGTYWCKVDSATLFIDDKALIKRKEFNIKLTREDIKKDVDLTLENGKLYVASWGQAFPVEESGDTLMTTLILRDTLFAIGDDHVLKPFKGHLILNTKLEEHSWAVMVASNKGGGILTLANADLPENLSRLDSIIPVFPLIQKDTTTTQILISPTKAQFAQILEKGLLFDSSCTEFERILPIKID